MVNIASRSKSGLWMVAEQMVSSNGSSIGRNKFGVNVFFFFISLSSPTFGISVQSAYTVWRLNCVILAHRAGMLFCRYKENCAILDMVDGCVEARNISAVVGEYMNTEHWTLLLQIQISKNANSVVGWNSTQQQQQQHRKKQRSTKVQVHIAKMFPCLP